MTAPTPGQAAYEAYLPLAYDTCDNSPWDQRDPRDRDAFEAAAQAAISAAELTWDEDLRRERDGLHADRKRLTTALAEMTEERDRYRDMYQQAQKAHNAVADRNAELAAQLDRLREECNALATSHGKLHERLTGIRDIVLQGGQNGETVRAQLIALLADGIALGDGGTT